MTSVVLTIIDTAGIQDYIFGSNRLRENIGASYLVEQATRAWVYQCLPESHNVQDGATGALDTSKQIQQDGLAAELIYAGGGNTAILFRSLPEAQRFARDVSRRIIEAAPGLEIVIVHSAPFEWSPTANNLKDEMQKLRDERLAAKKRTRQATPTPLLGLGVTAACSSTGLVATQSSRGLEPATVTPRLVSRDIVAKLQAVSSATQRLQQVVERLDTDAQLTDVTFSDELDHLGRTGGQESYIGVVHIDGNDMGKLIQESIAEARDNLDYIARQRNFSAGVEEASEKALVATLRKLHTQFFFSKEDGWHVREVVPQVAPPDYHVSQSQQKIRLFFDREAEKPCWPVRPLVFGGDDVTFVCNGQLALSLATAYMRAFRENTSQLLGIPIHTGAGVCVVKVHYPFRRAYAVSERLTSSAKNTLGYERAQASALDWHFSTSGLGGELASIRQREYELPVGSLLMRPVRLTESSDWRTWDNFNRLVATLNYDTRWAGRRNKLKALRTALRGGYDVVQEFLRTYDIALPPLHQAPVTLHEHGWDGQRCGYFDALEALDHHFLLEELS